MKAPPHALCGRLLSKPWKGMERRIHSVPFQYSVLHHEAPLPGPGEESSWHLFLVSVMFDKASSPASQGARQLPYDTWE